MKSVRSVFFVAIVLLLSACATTARFPSSSVAPAADITATKKQDKNKNYTIQVTAKNLASPDRLSPSRKNYSVWIVTDNNTTKNIGQLINKNAKTAVLKATTPFVVREIFITAEDQGDNTYPLGTEISRTRFSD